MHFNQLNTPNNPFCQITKDRVISYLKDLDLKKGTDKLTPTLITLHKMCKRQAHFKNRTSFYSLMSPPIEKTTVHDMF